MRYSEDRTPDATLFTSRPCFDGAQHERERPLTLSLSKGERGLGQSHAAQKILSASIAAIACLLAFSCQSAPLETSCGPPQGLVQSVIDGDTVKLESGETVRYLLVDAPEIGPNSQACFGPEARELNVRLVENRTIDLSYDKECRDKYGRLLAYVTLQGRSINALLVERGFACVLQIPPNGESRYAAFLALQEQARASKRGLWGVCRKTCPDS